MRRTLMGAALVSATVLAAAIWSNESADAAQDDALMAVKQQFIGHYELVSFVSFPATGGEVDNNYVGRIMYDENDQMSAQGMPRDLPERAAKTMFATTSSPRKAC